METEKENSLPLKSYAESGIKVALLLYTPPPISPFPYEAAINFLTTPFPLPS